MLFSYVCEEDRKFVISSLGKLLTEKDILSHCKEEIFITFAPFIDERNPCGKPC